MTERCRGAGVPQGWWLVTPMFVFGSSDEIWPSETDRGDAEKGAAARSRFVDLVYLVCCLIVAAVVYVLCGSVNAENLRRRQVNL